MIDWLNLAANALWILSLSLIVAIVSLARYDSQISGENLADKMTLRVWQTPLNIAGVLFCCGLTFTSIEIWQQVIWAILTGLCIFHTIWNWLIPSDKD